MSVYEQIKDDFGYLQMDRAAKVFATLAEDARNASGPTSRLVAEQADATRNRRLAARLRYARFPFRRTQQSDLGVDIRPVGPGHRRGIPDPGQQ